MFIFYDYKFTKFASVGAVTGPDWRFLTALGNEYPCKSSPNLVTLWALFKEPYAHLKKNIPSSFWTTFGKLWLLLNPISGHTGDIPISKKLAKRQTWSE